MTADSVVRARLPSALKDRAVATLAEMGLSASDVIRLTFLRIAEEGRLPFAVSVPNAETRAAIKELDAGKGHRVDSVETLMKELED